MDSAQPSFYRLFRRSRYGSQPSIDAEIETPEKEWEREERERFAAAAIGFVLKHDEAFCRHFWETICRVAGDPVKSPTISADGIGIEPPRWSDLRVTYETGSERFVWVVEIKAGALLRPHQDPAHPDFWKPGVGYGALFTATENPKETNMRYVVLGSDGSPIDDGKLLRGIMVQHRDWKDLLLNRPNSPLFEDLVKSLGDLHIDPFLMEQAKNIIVADGLSNVGRAWKVLEGVLSKLRIRSNDYAFEGYTADNGDDYLGVYVKKRKRGGASAMHEQLAKDSGAEEILAWFGYIAGKAGIVKSVWLYFGDRKLRDLALRKVGSSEGVRSDKDGDEYCVVVESTCKKTQGDDFAWFTSVFERAVR